MNTWHHIPERQQYAKTLASVLRPNGAVYVVDYTMDSPQGPPKDHRLMPDRVMDELRAGGLRPSLAEETLPYQYVVVAR